MKYAISLVLVLSACSAPVQIGEADNGMRSNGLRQAVHESIAGHTALPYYDPDFDDTHDGVDDVDTDPNDADNVSLIYRRTSVPKDSWGDYNREHLWPQSIGLDDVARADLHNLFACDSTVNGDRGRLPFGECDGCSPHKEAKLVRTDGRVWEPPDEMKGDIARALFYMDVRYEGGGEPDLLLTDGPCTADACFPGLELMIQWHKNDPVSEVELNRNDRVEVWQNNRNPFIDAPELVCGIWECPVEPLTAPRITEIHYDNAGADVGEGVEISAPAGMLLDGWTVFAVNGVNGRITHEVALEGALEEQGSGNGALWLPMQRLQNGAADGVALVDPDGVVVERWSWEGTFEMYGELTVDVGVKETGSTPVGSALVRLGDGWYGPQPSSAGVVNEGA